jgi:hypothetical protein
LAFRAYTRHKRIFGPAGRLPSEFVASTSDSKKQRANTILQQQDKSGTRMRDLGATMDSCRGARDILRAYRYKNGDCTH